MHRWLQTFANPGSLRHVIVHVAGTAALRIFSLFALLATIHVLNRRLGSAGYGAYALAHSVLMVVTIPALLGLDQLVLRESASLCAGGHIDRLHALLRWAQRSVLISACSITGLALGVLATLFFTGIGDRETLCACAIGCTALPWLALTYVRQGALRGLHHVTLGFLPESVVAPVLSIAGILLASMVLHRHFTAPVAMLMSVAALVPAYYLGSWLLARHLPPSPALPPPETHARVWLNCAIPLMLVSAMSVINSRADILLLGFIEGKQAVGLYEPARRLADCIGLMLVTVNAALAPSIARLYAQKNQVQLQRMVTWSARGIMLVSLPAAVLLMVFSKTVLGMLAVDSQAAPVLVLLCVGQLVNGAAGSVGMLLSTTEYERDAVLGIGVGAAVNIGANLLLIPWWGPMGAAAAFVLGMITWNGLLVWFVFRRLNLHSTCLGTPFWRRT